jgi:hypothetical protein
MLMALGEKVMSGCAVTTWFVAPTENESAKQAKAAKQARTAITAPLSAGEWDPIALLAPMAHLDEIPWHHLRLPTLDPGIGDATLPPDKRARRGCLRGRQSIRRTVGRPGRRLCILPATPAPCPWPTE